LHSDRREEFGVLRKLDDNGAWELSQIAGMMLGMVCEIVLLATS